MYLNRLSREQKELFLDLCIHVAKIDEVFAEEEKRCVQDYCVEMQLEPVRYSANNNLDDVIFKITEMSTVTELRIIFLEIVALVLADKEFAKTEQDLIDKLLNHFNLTSEFKKEVFSNLQSLINIYTELNRIIFG